MLRFLVAVVMCLSTIFRKSIRENNVCFKPGVGKLFSRRAASTIEEWSRARACCLAQLHAIIEIALAQNFAICPCNVVFQGATTVESLNKKKKVIAFSKTVNA